MEEKERKHPSGEDILSTLIELLAEQEGLKIEYTIVERGNNENNSCRSLIDERKKLC